jgi:hypothetical protein
MPLTPRQKDLVARHLLAHQAEIPTYLKSHRWEELAALVEYADHDAPRSLIPTDPALYRTLRQQITQYRLAGWSCLNLKRLQELAKKKTEDRFHSSVAP